MHGTEKVFPVKLEIQRPEIYVSVDCSVGSENFAFNNKEHENGKFHNPK